MSKHTPGPWAYRDNGHFFDVGILHACSIVPIFPNVCIGVPHHQEANARLIAAAPELLEALKGMIEHFWIAGSESEFDAIKKAREAIAKAEGKQ